MMLRYVTIVSVYIILNMWQGLSTALLLWNYYYGTAQRQLGTRRLEHTQLLGHEHVFASTCTDVCSLSKLIL